MQQPAVHHSKGSRYKLVSHSSSEAAARPYSIFSRADPKPATSKEIVSSRPQPTGHPWVAATVLPGWPPLRLAACRLATTKQMTVQCSYKSTAPVGGCLWVFSLCQLLLHTPPPPPSMPPPLVGPPHSRSRHSPPHEHLSDGQCHAQSCPSPHCHCARICQHQQ
jgi:hypothetical protein